MANQYTSLIERYYDSLLNAEETAKFNKLKESDVDFQAELALFEKAEMLLELDAIQALKENARRLDKASNHKTEADSSFRGMKIAASILLISVVGSLFYTQNTYSNESLYQDNYSAAGDHISDLGNGKTALEAALEFYNKKKYTEATTAFEDIISVDATNQIAQFYLGQSLILDNKSDQGIKALLQVTGDYQPEARWYAALAQLKNNDESNCIATLKSILESDQDKTYVIKAKKLKAKLDSPLRRFVF